MHITKDFRRCTRSCQLHRYKQIKDKGDYTICSSNRFQKNQNINDLGLKYNNIP